MTCPHCGTEIAGTALICYRCGAATVEARLQPPAPGRRRWWPVVASLAALTGTGLYMAQVVVAGTPGPMAWAVGALALAGLIWGLSCR